MLIITEIVSVVKFLSILHAQIKPDFQKNKPLLVILVTRVMLCAFYLFVFEETVFSLF